MQLLPLPHQTIRSEMRSASTQPFINLHSPYRLSPHRRHSSRPSPSAAQLIRVSRIYSTREKTQTYASRLDVNCGAG